MSSLADRLRGVIGGTACVKTPSTPYADSPDVSEAAQGAAPESGARADAAAETLGGEWRERGSHRYLVIDRRYAPGHRHGRVAVMDCVPPDEGVWPALPLLERSLAPRGRLLFVDLETTGLAGGAGTYAFLVGVGWFDGCAFRVRQFFLSSFAAERALLEDLAVLAADAAGVVTFNGKTFDLPLIETRYLMQRLRTPFAGMPHVDMLHPARRLWRGDDDEAAGTTSSCRLTHLEETMCGMVREGDVPGFEIPGRYFHFVRTGDARPLGGVLEHNRLDLLSLALLTARAAQLLEDGAPGARTAREALGLGRLYERNGRLADASRCFERASELPGDLLTRAHALRALAAAWRRERRYDDAAGAWRKLIGLPRVPAGLVREATQALAVHHEHRIRDLPSARAFALQSLRFETSASRQQAVRHRLARIERKLGGAATTPLQF